MVAAAEGWTRLALGRMAPALLLIALTFAAYHGSFAVPELLDDETALSGNPSIRHLADAFDPPARAGTGGRPFANFTFALNYAWTEDSLWSYHLVNLVIHVAAALTLFGILRRTLMRWSQSRSSSSIPDPDLSSRASAIALTAAALWAVHPAATISVTYLSQRTESLMALFYLQTLYAFMRAAGSECRGWWVWSVAACFIGMATKEVMITAPVAVVLYDRMFVAESFRAALRDRWRYYLALASTWGLLAVLLQTGLNQRLVGFGLGVGAGQYALTESRAILLYVVRAIWPANLIFDYGPEFLSAPQALPYVMLLAIGGATLAALFWKRHALAFCGIWFLLILLPTSSIVPIAAQPIAENRLYLPLAGACTLLAIGGYSLLGRHGIAVVVGVAVAFTWLAERRNETFESPQALWSDTIAKHPNNPRAYDQHGEALFEAGKVREAIADYEHALALNPKSTHSHGLLGNALAALGEPAQALAHFRQAIELAPNVAVNYQNAAAALATLGDDAAAVAHYQAALRLDPDFATVHTNLGMLFIKLGRFAEAETELHRAVMLDPDDHRGRYGLAIALLQLGRGAEALSELEEVLRHHPDGTDARNAFGVALMRAGRLAEAQQAFEYILRVSPTHADALANQARIRQHLATSTAARE